MKREPSRLSAFDLSAVDAPPSLACALQDEYTARMVRVGASYRQDNARRVEESTWLEVHVSRMEGDAAVAVTIDAVDAIESAGYDGRRLEMTLASPNALRALASLLVRAAMAAEREGLLGEEMPARGGVSAVR